MSAPAATLDHFRAQYAQASAALDDPQTLEAVVTACEQRLGLIPARRAATLGQTMQAMTDGNALDPARGDSEPARLATGGHTPGPESSTLQTRSFAPIVYKGIPTTIDALAHGIETLALPGLPILQPAPEDAP